MKISNFEFNPLPGDQVTIDDCVKIPKGYYHAGMILKEKQPIKTDMFYIMLYPKHFSQELGKIILVAKEYITISRFINREHYEKGDALTHSVVTLLESLKDEFIGYDDPETFKSYVLSALDCRLKAVTAFTVRADRNCGKSYLSSTYGEVLKNGKTKQND